MEYMSYGSIPMIPHLQACKSFHLLLEKYFNFWTDKVTNNLKLQRTRKKKILENKILEKKNTLETRNF